MSDIADEMIRTLDRIVADTLTTARREAADGKGMSGELWSSLLEHGMTSLGEVDGEIPFADAMGLVQRAAYHAAPVPLAETVLARRLLSQAGIALPDGALTIAPPRRDADRGRTVAGVPYAGACAAVVCADGDSLELYATVGAVVRTAHNQAGEPREGVDLAKARPIATGRLAGAGRRIALEGALMRAVQLSGALERALEHTLTWVNERVQFGRPISKFQAIQHALAVMASETAAARAAVAMAVEASANEADPFAVAVAKSRAGEAAGKVANAAHAAFGAMGFTREHALHYSTRRLWAWRDEFGGEEVWQAELGRAVAAGGGRSLWATVTSHG